VGNEISNLAENEISDMAGKSIDIACKNVFSGDREERTFEDRSPEASNVSSRLWRLNSRGVAVVFWLPLEINFSRHIDSFYIYLCKSILTASKDHSDHCSNNLVNLT
jgi:hypothetical protein